MDDQRRAIKIPIFWENAPDPDAPNRTIRRKRRVDPLIAILGGGERDYRRWDGTARDRYEAAEWYRSAAEAAAGCASGLSERVSGSRSPGSYGPPDRQIDAITVIAAARRVIGSARLVYFECVVLGGMSLRMVAKEYRCRPALVSDRLADGLDALRNTLTTRGALWQGKR